MYAPDCRYAASICSIIMIPLCLAIVGGQGATLQLQPELMQLHRSLDHLDIVHVDPPVTWEPLPGHEPIAELLCPISYAVLAIAFHGFLHLGQRGFGGTCSCGCVAPCMASSSPEPNTCRWS